MFENEEPKIFKAYRAQSTLHNKLDPYSTNSSNLFVLQNKKLYRSATIYM